MNLGNVRSEKIKNVARDLVRRYPEEFTSNFEENKKAIDSVARIPTVRLRNHIVGYITRLMSQSKTSGAEADENPQPEEEDRQ